jgi:hypothetical protein
VLDLPTDLSRRYRYKIEVSLHFGHWAYDYSLVGARGGLNLHVTGPHTYDGGEHWGAGLELHSRTPLHGDTAPTHDECWLLKCPCWHDGTSLYAQEHFLPMVIAGDHTRVFRELVRYADDRWLDISPC